MAPTKWNNERNEALLVAFGNYLITNARPEQQMQIEDHMKDHGYATCTWEGIRYVHLSNFSFCFIVYVFVCVLVLVLVLGMTVLRLLLPRDHDNSMAVASYHHCLGFCSEPASPFRLVLPGSTDKAAYHGASTLKHLRVYQPILATSHHRTRLLAMSQAGRGEILRKRVCTQLLPPCQFLWPCECLVEMARHVSTVFNQVPSLDQSCSVRIAAVQTASVQVGFVQIHFVSTDFIQYAFVQLHIVSTDSIQYDSVQIHFVPTESIQYDSVRRSHSTTYLTVRNGSVQSPLTTSSTVTDDSVQSL
ncbi:hypothetical protein PG996_004221 [Apiospora saccharicola]|uniref:Uncharacterized protein n=1 Tax=Apiospora saccharicola TaxID=335842 RepID=A0ABR1W690_9PEZI